MSESSTATLDQVETIKEVQASPDKPKPKKQPRYNVILWDDQDHTHDYVIRMMQTLFHMPLEKSIEIAEEVDTTGRAICLTTTREHAELKRDQIHAFGSDPQSIRGRSKGSMWASIEPMIG